MLLTELKVAVEVCDEEIKNINSCLNVQKAKNVVKHSKEKQEWEARRASLRTYMITLTKGMAEVLNNKVAPVSQN